MCTGVKDDRLRQSGSFFERDIGRWSDRWRGGIEDGRCYRDQESGSQ